MKPALRRVSLEASLGRLARASEEEEECNLEVWSTLVCPARGSLASSSPSTAGTRDVDGISSVIRCQQYSTVQ